MKKNTMKKEIKFIFKEYETNSPENRNPHKKQIVWYNTTKRDVNCQKNSEEKRIKVSKGSNI